MMQKNSDDFISCCIRVRKTYPEMSSQITNLMIEVTQMGKNMRADHFQFSQLMVDLFTIILPYYYDATEQHEYFEFLQDVLFSNIY